MREDRVRELVHEHGDQEAACPDRNLRGAASCAEPDDHGGKEEP
jgi:hypothetical protein